jgi:hypothetical protein
LRCADRDQHDGRSDVQQSTAQGDRHAHKLATPAANSVPPREEPGHQKLPPQAEAASRHGPMCGGPTAPTFVAPNHDLGRYPC